MEFQEAVENLINGAAKPVDSLGLLEMYLKKLMIAWEDIDCEIKPHHLIFAADNGIVEEGVAAYPPIITYLQARSMVDGKATISCFCNYHQIPYLVIDIGINNENIAGANRRVAFGTKNFLKEEAMTSAQFSEAWSVGHDIVKNTIASPGANLISFGEMGIGNTTTSSAVLHAMTGILPEFVVGYGASANNAELIKRKCSVISRGVERHRSGFTRIEDILRCVGGFDIVAMTAGMVACTEMKTPFVFDGFIGAVAFACAARMNKQVERYAIPSHLSKEPGMKYALLLGNILADDVPIQAKMGLGEGTGAILMVVLLKTMLFTIHHMARLSDFAIDPVLDKPDRCII